MNANQEHSGDPKELAISKGKAPGFHENPRVQAEAKQNDLHEFLAQIPERARSPQQMWPGGHIAAEQTGRMDLYPGPRQQPGGDFAGVPGQNPFQPQRGFVNSGDLLVQQFLLENIQKQKGRRLMEAQEELRKHQMSRELSELKEWVVNQESEVHGRGLSRRAAEGQCASGSGA